MNAPHRLPGVAPDELESFRIYSHVEVVTLLRSLVRARSRCSVQFGEGAQDFLATTLLAVNPEFEELVFDCGSDPVANGRLQRAAALEFFTSLDQIRIQFSTHAAEPTIHERLPALRVRLPESVVRLQRREYFRVATPVVKPLLAAVPDPKDPRRTLQLRLLDLSVGGFAMFLPEGEAPPALGSELEGCSLELPEAGRVIFNASVRSVAIHSRPPGTRIGCAFLRLPGQAHKSIQRQILAMERERGARA